MYIATGKSKKASSSIRNAGRTYFACSLLTTVYHGTNPAFSPVLPRLCDILLFREESKTETSALRFEESSFVFETGEEGIRFPGGEGVGYKISRSYGCPDIQYPGKSHGPPCDRQIFCQHLKFSISLKFQRILTKQSLTSSPGLRDL